MSPLAKYVLPTLTALAAITQAQQPEITTPDAFSPDTEVGLIGKEHVKFDQLPSSAQAQLAESQRRYEQQLHQLAIDYRRKRHALVEAQANNFIDSKITEEEAKARGVTVQQLVQEVKVPEVAEADARAFYEQHKQQIKQPFEQAMIPITQYLTQQSADKVKRDYLAKLRAKYSARMSLEPLREDVAPEGPSRGPKGARVTIVEFADFQCPYCGQIAPILKQITDRYPQDVRLVYRNLPLTGLHPNAMHAAAAGFCAQKQGKFWEMHDALFASQNALSLDELAKTAERLELETKPFQDCIVAQSTESAIESDAQAGVDAGVNGTPGLFINGRFFDGAMSYERLAAIVDDELARQGLTPTPSRVASVQATAVNVSPSRSP